MKGSVLVTWRENSDIKFKSLLLLVLWSCASCLPGSNSCSLKMGGGVHDVMSFICKMGALIVQLS